MLSLLAIVVSVSFVNAVPLASPAVVLSGVQGVFTDLPPIPIPEFAPADAFKAIGTAADGSATTFVETLQIVTSPVANNVIPNTAAPTTLATTVTVEATLIASAAGYQYSIVPPISTSDEVEPFLAASCVFEVDGTTGVCVEEEADPGIPSPLHTITISGSVVPFFTIGVAPTTSAAGGNLYSMVSDPVPVTTGDPSLEGTEAVPFAAAVPTAVASEDIENTSASSFIQAPVYSIVSNPGALTTGDPSLEGTEVVPSVAAATTSTPAAKGNTALNADSNSASALLTNDRCRNGVIFGVLVSLLAMAL